MIEIGSKEWKEQPVFPGARFKRQASELRVGSMDGYSPQLKRKYKEITTSSFRMPQGEFLSTFSAAKKRLAAAGKR